MLAEDEQGPAWLQDYNFTDFSSISADIDGMQEFASKLQADVQKNYVPHRDEITDAMMTELTAPTGFNELYSFLFVHNAAQNATLKNVYSFGKGTTTYASAVKAVGQEYQGSDAFSHAKVSDIDDRLGAPPPQPADSAAGTTDTTGSGDV